ncbi:hypothetical protein [Pseudaestuariivita rosea]|uniref:hypothetical protein n=1 Tax=Pseudaestuariivita rosea TaxID=2763263 RepID=UPI001ABA1469|nr:hypothetical protein [Pseudaestuariivita rosea]
MATFTVTTLADEPLATDQPLDPIREAEDGAGLSLREAIDLANALDGADEIVFHPDLANGRMTLSGEPLRITDDVTIDGDALGDGASRIILDGDYRSRVLIVEDGTSVISDVDITRGGNGPRDENPFVGNGAGVSIDQEAELTLDDARIYRNGAGTFDGSFGGGIFNEGTLRLTNSEVFENSAGVSRAPSSGGGIANFGTLIVEDTLISDNNASGRITGGGGGILNTGTASLTNVAVVGNFGGNGAGINNSGTMVVSNATIADNTGSFFFDPPNGVWNTGDLTFIHSTITANAGVEIANRAELTLVNSIVTETPGWIVNQIGHNIIGTTLFDGDTAVGQARAEDIFANVGPNGPVLTNNGGALPTILLRASDLNPAIDVANATLAVDATGAPLVTDSRGAGFGRIFDFPSAGATDDGLVDLGALELDLDPVDTLIFNETPLAVLSYGDQDGGTFEIDRRGDQLIQSENAWNHLLIDHEITEDTILTFRLDTQGQAEIFGIGFDNDDTPDSDTYFQLGGTQQGFGIQDFNAGPDGNPSGQFYSIPVGEYFTGQFDRLVFVTDQDDPNADAQATSFWSSVSLFEPGPRVRLNGDLENIRSYSAEQDRGTFDIFDNGEMLLQEANSWQKIDIDYEVTEKTVLTFEFTTFGEGELHAIGFDNDDMPDSDTYFTLLGTQDGFGNRDFFDSSVLNGNQRRFEIPVGEYFTGQFDSLVLVTDLDAGGVANSLWSELTLSEIA